MGYSQVIQSTFVGQTANPMQPSASANAANLYLLNTLAGTQPPSSSNSSIRQSLVQLAELLGSLQEDINQLMLTTSNANVSAGNALIQEATNQTNMVIAQVKKMAEEQSESHKWGIFSKVIGGIVGAVMAVAGLVTLDPALALAGIAIVVMSTTPIIQDLTSALGSAISAGLRAAGVSTAEANSIGKVVADVIVIILLIAITISTDGASSPDAAGTIARVSITAAEDAGEEMTEISSVSTASIGGVSTASATEETATLSRLAQISKMLSPFRSASRVAFVTTQGISSTGLINDSTNLAMAVNGQKEMSTAERKLELGLAVLNDILGLLSGAIAAGAAVGNTAASASGQFGKFMQSLKSFAMTNSKIFDTLYVTEIVGTLLQVSGQTGQALISKSLADSILNLTDHQAALSLLQYFENMISSQTADMIKTNTSAISALSKDIGDLSGLAKMDQELAQELS